MAITDPVDKLLRKIERTARALNRAPGAVAKDVLGDGKAYPDMLNKGWRGISFERVERASENLDRLAEGKPLLAKKKPSARALA